MSGAVAVQPRKKSDVNNEETITEVRHWTDKLFSFRTTREKGFRFSSGQFAMIGLEINGRPLMRAYSMASAPYDDFLEFYSIKVPDGPLTSNLQHVRVGDTLLVSRKPVGTLVISSLKPGRCLYLLSTGTGLAPFASIIKDPEAYENFETVVLVHGCRNVGELEYGTQRVVALREDEFLGEMASEQLRYYATVTREPFWHQGRVTDLIENGKLFEDLGLPPIDPEHDRAMICGSPGMLADTKALLEKRGFTEGNANTPGAYVYERAFVER